MKMRDAENEALRLFPDSTIILGYERFHLRSRELAVHPSLAIQCSIWVADLREHFKGPNWATAVMNMRNALHLNQPQQCPDEEIEALPAAVGV